MGSDYPPKAGNAVKNKVMKVVISSKNTFTYKNTSILRLEFLRHKSNFQSSDTWSLLGHVNYLTQRMERARECYERTLSYVDEPTDVHSVLLRLATIYLKEGQVHIRRVMSVVFVETSGIFISKGFLSGSNLQILSIICIFFIL